VSKEPSPNMDDLVRRLEHHAMFESNDLEDDLCDAIKELRAYAEREKEYREALKKAEFGLEAIVGFYARVTFTGSRVAADEQNPCISIAMKAQNVARAILSKHKEPAT